MGDTLGRTESYRSQDLTGLRIADREAPRVDWCVRSHLQQSRRLAAVQLPVIPIVGRWIAETPGTISLGQGVVSYAPPPEVLEAVRAFGGSLADHRYGPVEGFPALVEALESKLARENGIAVRPASRVVVTAGGNQAFLTAILALTDPADEIILAAPYYFNHEMAIVIAGAVPVGVHTGRGYQLDVQAIADAITERTRGIVTVSPNNPTGAVYPEAALRAVNALCRERGIFHIHDEAYEYFTYAPARHFSPGSIADAAGHTLSLYSLSKAYGMASWRVGYMVIPDALWEAVNKIQDTLLICPPAVSQHAALAALRVGRAYPQAHLTGLDRLRHTIFDALSDPGVPCEVSPVEGAFYYLLRVDSALGPMALVERLIREHKVATIPGSAFADHAPCSIRVSYGALDPDAVVQGLERLTTGLRALGNP
jgi:aspartate/methionine/tyrosine aminotransferase